MNVKNKKYGMRPEIVSVSVMCVIFVGCCGRQDTTISADTVKEIERLMVDEGLSDEGFRDMIVKIRKGGVDGSSKLDDIEVSRQVIDAIKEEARIAAVYSIGALELLTDGNVEQTKSGLRKVVVDYYSKMKGSDDEVDALVVERIEKLAKKDEALRRFIK